MNYQEAIETLQFEGGIEITGNPRKAARFFDGLDVAISALKELKLYKDGKLCLIPESVYSEQCDELDAYKQLGTLEEVREAVDKQNAKKPDYEGDGYAPDGSFIWDTWVCPRCETKYEVDYDDYDYCPNCGQRIDLSEDWSEEDDR